MLPERLNSIARETRATDASRVAPGDEAGSADGGRGRNGKYVYVYGIVDYAADGTDSMINMCDCAWPLRDEAMRNGAKCY